MRVGSRRFVLFAGFLLLSTSCRNTDILETELYTREVQYEQLSGDFQRLRLENQALQHEVISLQQQRALPPETAGPTFGLRRIAISRLSGGCDLNNSTGDDALYLIVEPYDVRDHIIKVPGTLQVTALEVNYQGIKAPLSTWEVPPDRLMGCWQQGVFSSGFALTLPWTNWPACEDLRITVRFILTDGRVFEADRDIRIVLSPSAGQLPRPLPGETPSLIEEGLPAPQPAPPQPHEIDAVSPAAGRLTRSGRPFLGQPRPLTAE